MNIIVPQNFSMWKELSEDCTLEVLGHLSPRKVGTCALVCNQWNQFLNSAKVWQSLSRRHFPSIHPAIFWNFQGYVNFYTNLTKGVCSVKTLQEHTDAVWSLAVKDGFCGSLFSGSADHTLKNWNPIANTCYATRQEHTGWVCCLAINGDYLFSGSSDHTIRIWNTVGNICIDGLLGHKGVVCALAVEGNLLFSGSADKTIKVWDLEKKTCIATLEGHTDTVRSLVVSGNRLFSGSWDRTIKVWDLSNLTCVDTLFEHTKTVCSLAANGKNLFSGSWDNTIKVFNLSNLTWISTMRGHKDEVFSLVISDNYLFSSSKDKTIKVWDLNSFTCIATLEGHTDKVTCLLANRGKLFSGSSDNTIRVWDFTARHDEILMEIAWRLETFDLRKMVFAMDCFSKMPKGAKNKIFGELYKIIKSQLKHDYWGCAEDAFYGKNEQSATIAQKAQAIRNYVRK